jgi:hypothetical protein
MKTKTCRFANEVLQIGQIFKNSTSEGRYLVGEATSCACGIACAILITCLFFYLRHLNKVRDDLTPEQRQQWIDEGKTGDAHPDFRYIL